MPSVLERSPSTTDGMAKKNQGATNRKTPRVNVGVPEPWHAVLRKLAAKRKQPVLYLLISLALEAAEAEGIPDLPPTPWDEDGESDE